MVPFVFPLFAPTALRPHLRPPTTQRLCRIVLQSGPPTLTCSFPFVMLRGSRPGFYESDLRQQSLLWLLPKTGDGRFVPVSGLYYFDTC